MSDQGSAGYPENRRQASGNFASSRHQPSGDHLSCYTRAYSRTTCSCQRCRSEGLLRSHVGHCAIYKRKLPQRSRKEDRPPCTFLNCRGRQRIGRHCTRHTWLCVQALHRRRQSGLALLQRACLPHSRWRQVSIFCSLSKGCSKEQYLRLFNVLGILQCQF
jgi:hypothetical protein